MRLLKRKLIVNADDFGFGERITDGIIDSHENGIVTSTTLMANMDAAEYAAIRSKSYSGLGVGVHLVLTEGKPISPLSKVPDLIGKNGKFLGPRAQARQLWRGEGVFEQVKTEFEAQILRAKELGVEPTHCDSHHGIHRMPLARKALGEVIGNLKTPRVRNQLGYFWAGEKSTVLQKFCAYSLNSKYAIKMLGHLHNQRSLKRLGVKLPDYKVKPEMLIGAPKGADQALMFAFSKLQNGVSEMIFHPGYEDLVVSSSAKFTKLRLTELGLLTNSDVVDSIRKNNIQLVNFSNI